MHPGTTGCEFSLGNPFGFIEFTPLNLHLHGRLPVHDIVADVDWAIEAYHHVGVANPPAGFR